MLQISNLRMRNRRRRPTYILSGASENLYSVIERENMSIDKNHTIFTNTPIILIYYDF